MASQIEFAVQMTCEACVKDIKQTLKDVGGIKNVDVQLKNQSVVVETTLGTDEILKLLKSTGRNAVVKGSAGSSAGVAIIECGSENVQGVIRFMQINDISCVVDGTVDGLTSKPHSICVHECGDMSNGCDSVGNLYIPCNSQDKHAGILGQVTPDEEGRISFRFTNSVVNLSDITGRSIVIAESDRRLACGIIARSAGLFQNPKVICACDGISIWDEKEKPKSSL